MPSPRCIRCAEAQSAHPSHLLHDLHPRPSPSHCIMRHYGPRGKNSPFHTTSCKLRCAIVRLVTPTDRTTLSLPTFSPSFCNIPSLQTPHFNLRIICKMAMSDFCMDPRASLNTFLTPMDTERSFAEYYTSCSGTTHVLAL